MRTHNIPHVREIQRISQLCFLAMASWLTLVSSNYPCLKHLFVVSKVFEPLKFNCMYSHTAELTNSHFKQAGISSALCNWVQYHKHNCRLRFTRQTQFFLWLPETESVKARRMWHLYLQQQKPEQCTYSIYPSIRQGFFPLERLQITKSVLWNFAIIPISPFLNNPKDLDPSYKMDLDLWDCFGRKKPKKYGNYTCQ